MHNLDNLDYALDEVKDFITHSSENSGVYVGCDSKTYQKKGVFMVAYVAVVIIHYNSKNGGKVFKFMDIQRNYGSLKQRLLNEVMMACSIGYELGRKQLNEEA